ncbi:MAG: GNAT family N-acetyltransferase [Holosporales bacterium]|jgi:ribosomal-protein-alanine N-acetyltransferase|nr:GNAT family N-acetyltransferase [Holosporales bacterium]
MDSLQNTNFRKLNVIDLEKIKMFHVEHFSDYEISEGSFRAYLSEPQYEVFGAFHFEELVGYLILISSKDTADVIYIAVHPNYRKKRIATKLLNLKCSTWNISKKKDPKYKIFLEVDKENIPAISFYKSQKFKIISIRKKYLKGKDFYLMRKRL